MQDDSRYSCFIKTLTLLKFNHWFQLFKTSALIRPLIFKNRHIKENPLGGTLHLALMLPVHWWSLEGGRG